MNFSSEAPLSPAITAAGSPGAMRISAKFNSPIAASMRNARGNQDRNTSTNRTTVSVDCYFSIQVSANVEFGPELSITTLWTFLL